MSRVNQVEGLMFDRDEMKGSRSQNLWLISDRGNATADQRVDLHRGREDK